MLRHSDCYYNYYANYSDYCSTQYTMDHDTDAIANYSANYIAFGVVWRWRLE